MAKVNQIEKKGMVNRWDCVKFQIIYHCFFNNIKLSPSEVDCLTLLALEDEVEVPPFCLKAFENQIFKSTQSVRNALTKLEKMSLVKKGVGASRKKISINNIPVLSTGNILLKYQILSVEAN